MFKLISIIFYIQSILIVSQIKTIFAQNISKIAWVSRYDVKIEGFTQAYLNAIAIDNKNNIYVTGHSETRDRKKSRSV